MYYRQPRYFGRFQCIGSDCPDNCCYGWRIDWTKEEIEKLKNAPDISRELKELAENSFVLFDEEHGKYYVKFHEKENCPFQTAEGLCKIQKELGAEYLSYTCTAYPRHSVIAGGTIYRYCHTSCPEILKRLLNDADAADLLSLSAEKDAGKTVHSANGKDDEKKYPELKYRGELLEFYYELISDKRISVETAMILGALSAEKLTELVAGKGYDRIPEALKAFRKQFHNAQQLKKLENIKPNYYLKFGFLSELIEKIVEDGATALLRDQTGTLNIDLYNKGEAGLREALKGREHFLRDLALDLLLEFMVPFKFTDRTIFENYSLFVTAFGLLKLNLIAVCSTEKGITMRTCGKEFVYYGDDKLIGMTALISRGICQTDNKARSILSLLKDNNFTSPACLALLIK